MNNIIHLLLHLCIQLSVLSLGDIYMKKITTKFPSNLTLTTENLVYASISKPVTYIDCNQSQFLSISRLLENFLLPFLFFLEAKVLQLPNRLQPVPNGDS
ncbi:hypothetical protein PanWU01x14_292960 [Parasponia andersonii]|uniref:Uncharacterized protein n=1 Tax=Parasponia andersonii TaxID=3476 RepID=A0A2P5AWV5_PARAD|nr:hypothetical protein PanWU01x14_292960 [Parasponia andersonii]